MALRRTRSASASRLGAAALTAALLAAGVTPAAALPGPPAAPGP